MQSQSLFSTAVARGKIKLFNAKMAKEVNYIKEIFKIIPDLFKAIAEMFTSYAKYKSKSKIFYNEAIINI